MVASWFGSRSRKTRSRKGFLRQAVGSARKMVVERLEDRVLLTSTLYVDFGDRFPVAGLTGTVGTLRTATSGVAGDPAVAGPNMDKDMNGDFTGAATDDEDGFTMLPFATSFANGGSYTGGLTQLRADIMSFVRRFYEPYDIDVIELTANAITVNGRNVSGAANLAEISSTLGANEAGVAKNNDAYVLVGNMVVHRPAGDGGDIDISTVWGGYASTIDMPSGNASDNSAVAFVPPGLGAVNAGGWGNLIAHEAGHLFGFQHSLTQNPTAPPPGGVQVSGQIPTSEIMSYLGGSGFNFFSRYPIVRGNNNTNNNEDLMATSPPAPAGNRTPYDQWINTPSIGQNTDFHYITGTGANEVITITKSGGNANVSVQAFSDATFSTALAVPGSGGASTTYSYTLALDRPFIIDGGDLNDRVVVDGDLGITLTVRGMSGTDELVVMGKNAASGTYTPGSNAANGLDGLANLQGSVAIGSTTVNFQEFEAGSRVQIQDLTSLTLRTPLSRDLLSVDSPAAGRNRITGTSDGVTIVPMTFFNVGALTLDTATNDGASPNDNLTVNISLVAAGLQNFTFNSGAGADLFQINLSNYALPAAGGGISYQGGAGTDEIQATADVSFNLSDTSLAIVGDSAIALSSVNVADLAGIGSANTFTVSNWTGSAELDGQGSGDSYIVNFTGAGAGSVDIDDSGFSGADTVDVNGTAADNGLIVTSAAVSMGTEVVAYNGVESLAVHGLAGDDTMSVRSTLASTPVTVHGGDDDDTVHIGSLGNSLDAILGAVTVNGNAPAASDALFLNDQGDVDSHDYVITSTTVARTGAALVTYGTIESLTLNGSQGGNTINLQSTAAGTPVVVNAGAGNDDITVDANGAGPLADTVDLVVSSLTINGQGGTNTLLLEDFSDPNAATGDVVHVTPTQIGADPTDSFFGTGGSLAYSGLAHATLNLSNGYFPDTVYLVPSATTAFELHGNDPDCPMNPDQLPGDALYVDFTGVTDPLLVADGAGNATWTFGNREDVAFDGFEKLNHVGIVVVAPDVGSEPLVQVFDAETGQLKFSFLAFDPNFRGGVRVAVGDTNCDAIPDIIVAAGPGGAPEVRVFNGVTGLPVEGTLGSFLAYDSGSRAGVWVAAGDINQDGLTDIVTGPDNGGGPPLVRVYSGHTGALHAEFNAYEGSFQGGVRVAVGDVSGDGVPDIITAPGAGRVPIVNVFDGTDLTGAAIESFLAFDESYRHGLYLAVGDVSGDGRADIVASGGLGDERLVRVFDGTNLAGPPIATFSPYSAGGGDSIRVAVVDIDNDGDMEIVTAGGSGTERDPTVFDVELNPDEVDAYFTTTVEFRRGHFVAAGG